MELTKILKLGTMGFKPSDIKKINASGIDSDSIIALAENGYSAGDVDELITLTQESTDSTAVEIKHDAITPDDASKADSENSSVDYKKELETRDKEIEGMKLQISDLQNKLAGKKLADTTQSDTREKVQEIFKNIY